MWAVLKTIELGIEKLRIVNLGLIVKVRKTEETDGDYHTKHGGRAKVFMTALDATPPTFETKAIVGEIKVIAREFECTLGHLGE